MAASRASRLVPRPLSVCAVLVVMGCAGGENAGSKTPPAVVKEAPKPSEPATVTLTPDVERRLRIRMAPVERRQVARARTFGGEIIVPAAGASQVTAPVSGTLMVVPGGTLPASGATVRRGQPLLALLPRPSGRDVLRAAQARTKLPTQGDSASALVIRAPRDGVVRDARIADGQQVAAGAILMEVVSLDVLWVRVPIYVGDVPTIELARAVNVYALPVGPGEGGPARVAKPVAVPPPADPPSASADYFYELRNRDGVFRPGQKVGVTLQIHGQPGPSPVVPWSAVVHDVKGETWVYVSPAPHTFIRQRVEVQYVAGRDAILQRGPEVGTTVVAAGAGELLSAELGAGR